MVYVFRSFFDVVNKRITINHVCMYSVAQKVSHYQMIKKSHLVVLKLVNEIRFIHQIKV